MAKKWVWLREIGVAYLRYDIVMSRYMFHPFLWFVAPPNETALFQIRAVVKHSSISWDIDRVERSMESLTRKCVKLLLISTKRKSHWL